MIYWAFERRTDKEGDRGLLAGMALKVKGETGGC